MIRPARTDDYEAYTRLFAELAIPDPTPSREQFAQTVAQTSVACDAEGNVVGYVWWRRYGAVAHLCHVAVDRNARGQRHGERLLEHVRDQARASGCTSWYLNVKRDNAPALRLYERVGLRFELESFVVTLGWSIVPHVNVRERLAEPSDDAAIEAAFRIPAARVQSLRARGNFRLIVAVDAAGALDGFAAFDPKFPGAATFCARSPSHAVEMLVAIRHHADPAFDFVRITVEGDRPLADALLALGGELSFEILRLGAAL